MTGQVSLLMEGAAKDGLFSVPGTQSSTATYLGFPSISHLVT